MTALLLVLGAAAVLLVLHGPPRELRAPGRLARWLAAVGLASAGGQVALVVLDPVLEGRAGPAGTACYLLLGACASTLAWAASRASRLDPSVRRAWQRVAAGLVVVWLGDALFTLTGQGEVGTRVHLTDLLYVAGDAFILWGLVSLPVVARSPGEARRFWLDALTLAVCAAMLSLYSWGGGAATADTAWGHAVRAVYFLADGLLVLGIAVALLRQRDRTLRRPLWLLAASLGAGTLTDFAWIATSPWIVEVTSTAFWVFTGAAALALVRKEAGAGAPADVMPRFLSASLPFAVIGATLAVLLAGAVQSRDSVVGGLVGGALLLTLVVTARQALAFRDEMRLVHEEKAREAEARLAALVRNASDVILLVGPDLEVRYATPSLERVLGRTPESVLGSRLLDLFAPGQESLVAGLVFEAMRGLPIRHEAELVARRADGGPAAVEVSVQSLAEDPHVRGVVVTLRDLDERKKLLARLEHQAFHDPLTNLANRSLVRDRLAHAVARRPSARRHVAVLVFDVDDFKAVNDTLGPGVGDQVLTEVARRILPCVRPADTVGRLGGDEFAIVVEDVEGAAEAVAAAARVAAALRDPLRLGDREIGLSATTGIALSDDGASSADDLLRNADLALYMAKERGKGSCAVFEAAMHATLLDSFELGLDLRRAVARRELVLHFQPVVDLASGRVVGAEALVRWPHPERGLLLPARFIGLAEKTGLIAALGAWVLEAACRQAAAWADESAYVAVNVSAVQLLDAGFVDQVREVLAGAGLPARRLVLEITETTLLADRAAVAARLASLRDLGVRIAIDDFGTGYSSLGQLRDLPFDILKIDRSFVEAMGKERSGFVQLIVQLCGQMNLDTVAEGVETEEQLRGLLALGCARGQGYLLGRPMPPEDLGRLVASGARLLPA
ncbi:MAG: EAL domain-containing protein [Vicinamibacteria bacterium]